MKETVNSLKVALAKAQNRLRGWRNWMEETSRPHVSDTDRTTAVGVLRELADAIDQKRGRSSVADGWVEIALLCAAEDTIRSGAMVK